MDIKKLKNFASKLETVLNQYSASDREVKLLSESLKDHIDMGKQGKITAPLEYQSVPGSYFFNEGNLRKYADLEEAYAEFRIEITGGETKEVRNLLDAIEGYQGKA